MAWRELAQADGDIVIAPPNFYAVTASVKMSHSKADVLQIASDHGLNIFQYDETADDGSGYRRVDAQGQAVGSSSVPWKTPWFDIGDNSHINRAWVSPPVGAVEASTVAPTPPPTAWIVGGAIVAAVGVAWWLSRR